MESIISCINDGTNIKDDGRIGYLTEIIGVLLVYIPDLRKTRIPMVNRTTIARAKNFVLKFKNAERTDCLFCPMVAQMQSCDSTRNS